MKIEKSTLSGARVRLEPLAERHLGGLAAAITDGDLSALAVTTVPHPQNLPQFFAAAEAAFAAQRELAFATVDIASGAVVGSTRFRCIEMPHRRAEIGFTFIAGSWQRSYINTEAKYLMLAHAFEHWGLNRVEFMTDVRNTASRNAIVRLGAREEGVLRSHMVMRDGHVRDSVVFSVISADWPAVKQRLGQKLTTAA